MISQNPNTRCCYCGEGLICEHGKCPYCQKPCKKCEREMNEDSDDSFDLWLGGM